MPQELYSVAGQTIFPVVEEFGGPHSSYVSYPRDAVGKDGLLDGNRAFERTESEWIEEQVSHGAR